MKIQNKMMIFRVDLKNPYNLTAILLDLRHFLILVCNFVFPRAPDFNISSFWFSLFSCLFQSVFCLQHLLLFV